MPASPLSREIASESVSEGLEIVRVPAACHELILVEDGGLLGLFAGEVSSALLGFVPRGLPLSLGKPHFDLSSREQGTLALRQRDLLLGEHPLGGAAAGGAEAQRGPQLCREVVPGGGCAGGSGARHGHGHGHGHAGVADPGTQAATGCTERPAGRRPRHPIAAGAWAPCPRGRPRTEGRRRHAPRSGPRSLAGAKARAWQVPRHEPGRCQGTSPRRLTSGGLPPHDSSFVCDFVPTGGCPSRRGRPNMAVIGDDGDDGDDPRAQPGSRNVKEQITEPRARGF
jgi:hypothetical protein